MKRESLLVFPWPDDPGENAPPTAYSGGSIADQPLSKSDPDTRQTRAAWLEREIMPHEAAVRQMLRRNYAHVDIEEVLQSSYLRLMTTRRVGHVKNAKYYFFVTVRSEVRDRARRNQLAEFEPLDVQAFEVPADAPTVEAIVDSRRALQRVTAAANNLPPRQRQVIELRRIEGLCVRATAERLTISVSSVEKHQKQAIRSLAAARARF